MEIILETKFYKLVIFILFWKSLDASFQNNTNLINLCNFIVDNNSFDISSIHSILNDSEINDTIYIKFKAMITMATTTKVYKIDINRKIFKNIEILKRNPKIVIKLMKRVEKGYKKIYGEESQEYVKFMLQKSNIKIMKLTVDYYEKIYFQEINENKEYNKIMAKACKLMKNIEKCEKILKLFYPTNHIYIKRIQMYKKEVSEAF